MNKKSVSRRDFLKIVSGLGIAPVLGKLLKFFPEVDSVWAKGGTSTNTLLQPPKDLILKPIQGQKASQIISQVLGSDDVRTLQGKLPSFQPIVDEARVTSAVWSKGTQQAIVVAIPFKNLQEAEAVLQHVTTNGIPQPVMIEFTDKADMTKARMYTVAKNQV